jgi:hypothetical protein
VSSFVFITAVSALILLVLGIRAYMVLRQERDAPRGSKPGKGYHEIDASYWSGGGGGGHQGSFSVPKDPQEYARRFVPKDKR